MSISLVTIRDGAQQLSDKVGDLSVTTGTWNDWINQGVQSLWSLVANAFADHFFKTYDFSLVGNEGGNVLDVTAIGDFRRVRFLEVYPGTTQRRRVRGFNFDDKDIGAGGGIISQMWCAWRRYRLMGSKLYVEPFEQAGAPYRLYYLPKPTTLVADGDTMDPNVEEWWEYVICFAALKALGKEETDPGAVGLDFQRVKNEIIASAPSRDQGQSDRIADVEDGDEGLGWGWG